MMALQLEGISESDQDLDLNLFDKIFLFLTLFVVGLSMLFTGKEGAIYNIDALRLKKTTIEGFPLPYNLSAVA